MPRPRRIKRIFFNPKVTYFKPAGIRMIDLQETILTKEELEAIRLIDYENTSQTKAGGKMKISQPTLSRLLTSARKKIANALINGQAIKIQGGNFEMVQPRGMGRSGGGGRMGGGFAAGPGGNCVCPKCGHKSQHPIGTPCYQMKCPKCSSPMTRE